METRLSLYTSHHIPPLYDRVKLQLFMPHCSIYQNLLIASWPRRLCGRQEGAPPLVVVVILVVIVVIGGDRW